MRRIWKAIVILAVIWLVMLYLAIAVFDFAPTPRPGELNIPLTTPGRYNSCGLYIDPYSFPTGGISVSSYP